jgi:hypothetical protein
MAESIINMELEGIHVRLWPPSSCVVSAFDKCTRENYEEPVTVVHVSDDT